MGELEKGIKNEAIRNLTLWRMAKPYISKETAKRKDYVHVETVLKIVEEMRRKLNIKLLKEAYKDCENEEVCNLIHEFVDRFEKWLEDEV